MSDQPTRNSPEDPGRWLEGDAAAVPDALRTPLSAEAEATTTAADAAQLARIMQGVAANVARPELSAALGELVGNADAATSATTTSGSTGAKGSGTGSVALKLVVGAVIVGGAALWGMGPPAPLDAPATDTAPAPAPFFLLTPMYVASGFSPLS